MLMEESTFKIYFKLIKSGPKLLYAQNFAKLYQHSSFNNNQIFQAETLFLLSYQ